ncbi:MAG: hypothetical protein V3T22_07750 [Planctomycetota bacterium]
MSSTGSSPDANGNGTPDECEALGSPYCTPTVPNSTGLPGRIEGLWSAQVDQNDVAPRVVDLPTNALAYRLASTTQTLVANPGGSLGTCAWAAAWCALASRS